MDIAKLFQEKVARFYPQRFMQLVKVSSDTLVYTPVLKPVNSFTIPMFDYLYESVQICHRAGIYHNDIHEDNIMTDGEHPYLIDYGNMTTERDERDILQLLWIFIENPSWEKAVEKFGIENIKFEKMMDYIKSHEKYPKIKTFIGKEVSDPVLALIVCLEFYDVYQGSLGLELIEFTEPNKSKWMNIVRKEFLSG